MSLRGTIIEDSLKLLLLVNFITKYKMYLQCNI